MTLLTGLAVGSSCHAFRAGELAGQRALGRLPDPDVGVVVASPEFDQEEVHRGLRSVLGPLPLFGTTGLVQISSLGATRGRVVLLLMASEEIDFRVLGAPCLPDVEATTAPLAEAIREALQGGDRPATGLLVGDTGGGRGALYLRSLSERCDPPLPLSGGGSVGPERGVGWNTRFASQYLGDRVERDHFSLLTLEGATPETVRFAYGYQNAWTGIAPPVRVTRAEGNRVFEVDHTPLCEYLRSTLGDGFMEAFDTVPSRYTFLARLEDEGGDHLVVRSPLWNEVEENSIAFYPRVDMEGLELQLVHLSRPEMLSGAEEAARSALETLGEYRPAVAFLFSCQLRRHLLHSRASDEVARIQEVLGPEVPLVGLYAGGEFSPLYASPEEVNDRSRPFHGSHGFSTSITLLVVGTREGAIGEPDQHQLLLDELREDRAEHCSPEDYQRRIDELVHLLAHAEDLVDETESIFRHVNRRHFSMAETLRRRNRELASANRRSARLQKIIRQYTPHNVWKKAHRSVDAGYYTIPDEELTPVLMFLDVKGFTSFAEQHSSAEVIREINRIFEPATAIIYDHGGDVDKYIGDCIFATFSDSLEAVDCALEVQAVCRLTQAEGSPFQIRVGIHRGRVVSGNVGGTMRRDNTLIGDAVNLAQRLESACSPGSILVSGDVFRGIREELPPEIEPLRREIHAKGKQRPVEAYELTPP